jgi:hypothetical protein
MTKVSLVVLLVGLISGCATTHYSDLTESQKAIRIMKSDPDLVCKELGSVTGFNFWGSDEGRKSDIRINADELGANYIRLESVTNQLNGTAYKCP